MVGEGVTLGLGVNVETAVDSFVGDEEIGAGAPVIVRAVPVQATAANRMASPMVAEYTSCMFCSLKCVRSQLWQPFSATRIYVNVARETMTTIVSNS